VSGLTLILQGSTRSERVAGVRSFVGTDASGQFGILPNHEPLMTVLAFGMARYRLADGAWEYLGVPGGVLHFAGNELRICATRYVRGAQREELVLALNEQLRRETAAQQQVRGSMHNLEEEMLRRLWRMPRD